MLDFQKKIFAVICNITNYYKELQIEKSSFFEAINNRGLEQLQFVYNGLCKEAAGVLPDRYHTLGHKNPFVLSRIVLAEKSIGLPPIDGI